MTDEIRPPSLDSEEETLLGTPPAAASERSSTSGSLDGGRFAPGTLLEGRYRIVALAGRGGMGEVYRAEDLKLGETVALKFLPEELTRDGAALARLHQEVRLARRITHKNVVRVHDVGESDGRAFLAMEYIDGENLGSLLKRIGRLPEAKALELARQITAGLAAAHERGMVHRDLKPGNVMIDGEGHAKISDFGLAGLATELERPEFAGTPLYMAPEQLAEGRASFASDVYSLGLVLYEMFSGERPFRATTRSELLKEQRAGEPAMLTSSVAGVDPLVESAVAACLRLDPKRRPDSPLTVAAALPGGDPLAAALAAGETPSPEMVARASGQAAMSRPLAAALVGVTVACALGTAWLRGGQSMLATDRPLAPAVLEHRAREILEDFGGDGAHSRSGFRVDQYHWEVTRPAEPSSAALAARVDERPTILEFWYRTSDRPLAPTLSWGTAVRPEDPPPATAGVTTVRLDGKGRLRTLLRPPATGDAWAEAPLGAGEVGDESPGWDALFEAAELDAGDFRPVDPARAPPFWAERLFSWRGVYPGQVAPAIFVDAATASGDVVWWQVVEEPLVEARGPERSPTAVLGLVVFALIFALGGWLARRHLQNGRGDRRGALRLAWIVGSFSLLGWVLRGDHVASFQQFALTNAAIAFAALLALALWLLYVALEPYARRLTPRRLTSWTRLLDGRFTDPLVGRDLLIGLAAATFWQVLTHLILRSGGVTVWAYPHGLAPLEGVGAVVANAFHFMLLLVPIPLMAIVVAGRAIARSDRWAPLVGFALLLLLSLANSGFRLSIDGLLLAALLTGLGFYVGLLGLMGFGIAQINLALVPVSLDPSLWWARNSWVGIGVVLVLALVCYRTATRTGVQTGTA